MPIQLRDNGPGGNAWAVMGRVTSVLKQLDRRDEVDAYTKAAMSGDYDNLIKVSEETLDGCYIEWFHEESDDDDE